MSLVVGQTWTQIDMLVSSRYKYRTLSTETSSIRLLNVKALGTNESPDSQIHGTVEHVALDKAPPFHALSYTWGDPKDQYTVLLHDHNKSPLSDSLTVTRNCYEAILSLREKLGEFKIWIDAICVNQNDDDEKSHQIPLMGEIYSRASHVYIWLGPDSKSTSRAMACLDYIKEPELFSRHPPSKDFRSRVWKFHRKNVIAMKLDIFWPWRFVRCFVYLWPKSMKEFFRLHKQVPTIFPGAGYQRKHCVQVAEFQELLTTPWLQRIWTFQEILLARSPVVIRGRDHLDWDDFALGILTLNIANLPRKTQDELSLDAWMRLILDREKFLWQVDRRTDAVPDRTRYSPMHDYRSTVRTMPIRSICIHVFWVLVVVCLTISRQEIACPTEETSKKCYGTAVSGMASLLILITILLHYVLYRFQDKWSPPCQEVDGLVYAALTRQATKERDYYHGISCCVAALLGRLPQRVDPAVSDSMMHHHLALQLLRGTRCGHILVAAAIRAAAGCPSWVPDWNHVWSKAFDVYEEAGPKWSKGGATNDSILDALSGDKISTVKIRGRVIATITAIYGSFDKLKIAQKVKLCQGLLEKWKISQHCKPADHGTCKDHQKCLKEMRPEEVKYDRMRIELQKLSEHQVYSCLLLGQWNQEPHTPELKAWAEYSECVVEGEWCLFDAVDDPHGHSSCHTWDVGCAQDRIQVGDQIVLLSGVTTPLVVRSVNGMYRLISVGRRLDKAMTGKYWSNAKSSDYPYLELC